MKIPLASIVRPSLPVMTPPLDRARVKGKLYNGFSDIIERTPIAVMHISRCGTIIYANRGAWVLLAHWKCQVGEPIPQSWMEHVNEALENGEALEFEEQSGFKSLQIDLVPSSDANTVYLYGIDITARAKADQKLLLSSQVFDNVVEAVMITDMEGRILDVNNAFCAITYYTRDEILGEHIDILRSGRHDDNFYRNIWETVTERGNWQGEMWDRRKNGEIFPKWMSISVVPGSNGSSTRHVCLFSDISTLKQTQEQLYNMAHFDSLTGLPNRRNFQDRLSYTLEHAYRSGEMIAVMFMDLDDFKFINDHLGHGAGDTVLRETAERLRQSVRETDTVARMGGDEFTAILPAIDDTQNALIVAQKILDRIAEPLTFDHRELNITASIGIAIYPYDAIDAEALLQSADTALYRSKELGKNSHQFFSQEMNTEAMERLALQTKLRHAIGAKEFLVYYQPQIDISTGELVGIEALARWRSPNDGIVSAAEFIDIAEETGLIQEMGKQLFWDTCRQGRAWHDAGLPPVRIAVNISAMQLRQPDFIQFVETVVHETGFSAEMLEFELTESMLVDATPETLAKLTRLKEMKASIAIDDFGTKYSSLSYLQKFPIDRLKIDRSFIKDIPADMSGLAIAAAIYAMGQSLNLSVVTEGVETKEQAVLLKSKGCSCIQGYYCSPAMPPDTITPLLARGRCHKFSGEE